VSLRQESHQGQFVASTDIVMIDIDDESIDTLGRIQNWPRAYDAQVLAYIGAGHPKAIGCDILYTESDTLPAVWEDLLAARGIANPHSVLNALSTDDIFTRALELSGVVYLALFDDDETHHVADTLQYRLLPHISGAAALVQNFRVLNFPVIPIEQFRSVAAGIGSINMPPSEDGVVRDYVVAQVMPHPASKRDTVPLVVNFPVLMAMRGLGVRPESLEVQNRNVALGTQRMIPIDARGSYRLNWLGRKEKFRHISYWKIIQEKIPMEFFEDKYVILGATAAGLNDTKITPRGPMPGMEVHATALMNFLNDSFVFDASVYDLVPYLLLWALLLQAVFMLSTPLISLVVAAAVSIGQLAFVALYAYPVLDLAVPISAFFMITILGYGSNLIYKYLTEGRERARLKRAFETYVPPDVVGQILESSEALVLGGQKRFLTVLFSDIRGFTTFSETLDPQELVAFLNFYLSAMSEVIFQNKGTIDKFIGDAIMAVFGAPLSQPDNASRACLTSLAMIRELGPVNERQKAMNLPPVRIGIGLNTGDMTAGNIGSDRRFDYTVIGDAVNLGSRLEGLNKYFGTAILVSDTTKNEAGNGFVYREIAAIKVKGKDLPVVVWELLDTSDHADIHAPHLTLWNAALDLWKAGKVSEAMEAFIESKQLRANDGAVTFYLELCDEYIANPDRFSAVVKMDSK
jgi:adenylate cyclase